MATIYGTDEEVAPVPVARPYAARRLSAGEERADRGEVAAEVPVALVYNGVSHAVMMATPDDLEDFAVGFSLAEGIVAAAGEVRDLAVVPRRDGIEVQLTIAPRRFAALEERRRSLAGRTGCGLCGVESLAQVVREVAPLRPSGPFGQAAIAAALREMPEGQALRRRTRATHACAWADPEGRVVLLREDVGRHNALDKLAGAMAARGLDPAGGFLVVTSRCSFEMVQKAATVGIGCLVAVSAPTSLALDLAEQAGVTVAAFARGDALTVFTHPGRILQSVAAT